MRWSACSSCTRLSIASNAVSKNHFTFRSYRFPPPQASGLAKYWRDSNGNRYAAPIAVVNANTYGEKMIVVQTPKVLATVKSHFNCPTATVRCCPQLVLRNSISGRTCCDNCTELL